MFYNPKGGEVMAAKGKGRKYGRNIAKCGNYRARVAKPHSKGTKRGKSHSRVH